MPSTNELKEHEYSSQSTSTIVYQCSHCLVSFCLSCLIQHQHIDVKHEFIDMIYRIDQILARFLNHAHTQTEWTNHLTKDRQRLESYTRHIENYYKDLPIFTLPSYQWVNHVRSLICNNSLSIHEDCSKLFYPSLNSSIKS